MINVVEWIVRVSHWSSFWTTIWVFMVGTSSWSTNSVILDTFSFLSKLRRLIFLDNSWRGKNGIIFFWFWRNLNSLFWGFGRNSGISRWCRNNHGWTYLLDLKLTFIFIQLILLISIKLNHVIKLMIKLILFLQHRFKQTIHVLKLGYNRCFALCVTMSFRFCFAHIRNWYSWFLNLV